MDRALIFDFDGTLVDSEPLHALALEEVLAPLGMAFDHALCVGLPDADVISGVFARHGQPLTPEDLERLMRAKSAAASRLWERGLGTPYAGAVELLTSAASEGWKVAVCTAAMRREAGPVLERLGVTRHLSAFVTADDVAQSKPDPACYELTCRRLDLPPSRCVVLEDSVAGAKAGLGAGCFVVGLGHTTPPQRLPRTPRTARHISELTPELLGGWLDA